MSPLRLAGVEDGSFEPFGRGGSTLLCCACTEGARILWVKNRFVEVDGLDATARLIDMLTGELLDAVILGGISFAGFNVVDAAAVNEATGCPVVVYIQREPGHGAMREALHKHFPDWESRWRLVEQLGGIRSVEVREGEPPVFYEVCGASPGEAEAILRGAAVHGRTPEPVRVAGIVARGLTGTPS